MTPISIVVNQFKESNIQPLLPNIEMLGGTMVQPTVSLCHQCHQHIPAYTYHINGEYWLVKRCAVHGITHHMIERDYKFVQNLKYNLFYSFNNSVLIEASDRCNADCPHCYHIPDNKIIDVPINKLVERIQMWYRPGMNLCLTGAEASLRKDFSELITRLVTTFNLTEGIGTMTNGIRFADKEFLQTCKDAGLAGIMIGLNHPSYLDNVTIRKKQIQAINNANELGLIMGYISYTMSSLEELEDILEETTINKWNPHMYRIRYGSDIGRYPNQLRMYTSDIYKAIKAWCIRKGKNFEIMDADNNLYHVMAKIDGQEYRIIQWCDETDIHMEELRSGPWCDFVSDGLTNFLHQIIRRDLETNQKLILLDHPPMRYQITNRNDNSPLDFSKLYI